MSDNRTVFDDIMQGLHEIEEYQKGNLQLRTRTVTIDDEDIERNDASYMIYEKVSKMSEPNRQRVAGYVDGLLETATG